MNQDRRIDVLSTAEGGHELAWWKNTGSEPVSWEKLSIADFIGASDVITFDLDQDGDPDVLAAGRHLGALKWWENLSNATN